MLNTVTIESAATSIHNGPCGLTLWVSPKISQKRSQADRRLDISFCSAVSFMPVRSLQRADFTIIARRARMIGDARGVRDRTLLGKAGERGMDRLDAIDVLEQR